MNELSGDLLTTEQRLSNSWIKSIKTLHRLCNDFKRIEQKLHMNWTVVEQSLNYNWMKSIITFRWLNNDCATIVQRLLIVQKLCIDFFSKIEQISKFSCSQSFHNYMIVLLFDEYTFESIFDKNTIISFFDKITIITFFVKSRSLRFS